MPRPSDDAILSQALSPAILDRESYAQACGDEGPEAEAATRLKVAFETLRGKSLKTLTSTQLGTARLALIYAEQWEASLADANAGLPEEAQCRRDAERFRKMRVRRWGLTELEAAVARGKPIRLQDIAPNSTFGR